MSGFSLAIKMIADKKGTNKDKNKGVWLCIESEEGIKRIMKKERPRGYESLPVCYWQYLAIVSRDVF